MRWNEHFQIGYHVEKLDYYYSREHKLLGFKQCSGVTANSIGENGENLTIAVLSMNRASLTIRLMDSIKKCIPEFAGEFLIGDNGSDETEKAKLYEAISRMPYQCRIIEFGKNCGVAGGRNRLFKEAQNDWILSADNDLYFVGNPLKKIQEDLGVLGCHFLTLPIVDKENHGTGIYGGHIYVENLLNQVGIGGSSLYFAESVPLNVANPPFLCTFLPGGAAILNKETFYAMDAFDDNMFVGFEDVEFSLRLFQRGMKVGGCGMVSIIHDHPKPEISADVNYERKRFSTDRLRESGQYFERKHGFSVWNFTSEEWVNKRLNELTLDVVDESVQNVVKKRKIALVVDRPGWALDNIASQIIRYLSDEFEIKKIYQDDAIDCLAGVLLLADDCDLIHFLWRPLAAAMDDEYTQHFIQNLFLTEKQFRDRYIHNKVISAAVYDHFFLEGDDKSYTYKLFTDEEKIVNCYSVSSEKLKNIYDQDKSILLKPSAVLQDGVDCELFRPMNIERFDNIQDRTIHVGWVGNSKWQINDLKGINTIIKPAVEDLKVEGYKVELDILDRNFKMIPHSEMPDYYKNIDIYICASLCEGTPNPVLEAMACGVPVISTDVGIVKEVFGPKQSECILEEREVECLKQKLRTLMDNPSKLKELSAENLEYIQKWDWSFMSEKFRSYFRNEILTKDNE